MSRILDVPLKKRKLQYERGNLQRAFEATQRGMSVFRAAREYMVPESTLRDRTRGFVDLHATTGFETIFTREEEHKLVNHISYMAEIGYGYNASSIKYMAKDYADSLGKTVKAKEALSDNWYYSFLKRWSSLKVVKPQKLSIARAKCASRETLENYYKELGSVLNTNGLRDTPQNIYNVDETGISSEHSPPKIVCDISTRPQNITSSRSSNVTIIAAGNALGNSIPPYFIFPGQRWNDEFLNGSCTGADGEMSKNGWSNSMVFHNYITKHFAKFARLSEDKTAVPHLIIYDGHKSHISLTLADWAKKYNVILFVLPPHSSHVTQPLDVAVFGPFKAMYYSECQAYMRRNPGASVTKYQIAELTARPYIKALSAENLVSAFRRTGIHPFDSKVIPDSEVAPSVIYINEQAHQENSENETNQSQILPSNPEQGSLPEQPKSLDHDEIIATTKEDTAYQNAASEFFKKRTITKAIQTKPKKKFIPPFISGSLMKKSNVEVLKNSQKAKQDKMGKSDKECVKNMIKKGQQIQKSTVTPIKMKENQKKITLSEVNNNPQPSTSGTNKDGKPIDIVSEDCSDSEYDAEIADEEKCCMCNKWEPDELKECVYVSLVSWGRCDFCTHWTHLKTCSKVRVLRRDSVFRCPHCLSKE